MERSAAKVLWDNVQALMLHHWGEENLNRLARDARIGPGTASRIKDLQTAVRITTLDKVAKAFKLSSWQLLVPDLEPDAPPVATAATQKLSQQQIGEVEKVKDLLHHLTPAQRDLFIQSDELKAMMERAPYPDEKLQKWSAAAKSPSRRSSNK